MDFFALDVETANADYSSICQIGIVHFKDGQIVDKWSSLVNPEAYFDSFNTSIHGITEEDVSDAPTFDTIHKLVAEKISNKITVHHMPFDRIAITRACTEYNLEIIQPKWLDSAKIARRTWEQFAAKGYGLANISKYLGIEFEHHDALEDAIAAAKIVCHACEKNQFSVEEWFTRVGQPLFTKLEGNLNGSLYGENLVFTGSLFLPRRDAAKIAADIGCNVGNSVSSKTTILVVGTQDASKLVGYEKSSKHRKAEDLFNKGIPIKILSEKDFIELCNNENKEIKLDIPESTQKLKKPIKKEVDDHKTEMNFEVNFGEILNDEINKFYDNLSDEEKSELRTAEQQSKDFLDSIVDCPRSDKRRLAEELNANLENVQELYNKYNIQEFEDDDIDIIDTLSIFFEVIDEMLFDLKKGKISLADIYSEVDSVINDILLDLDETIPKQVHEFCNSTLVDLEKIKEKLLSYSKINEN